MLNYFHSFIFMNDTSDYFSGKCFSNFKFSENKRTININDRSQIRWLLLAWQSIKNMAPPRIRSWACRFPRHWCVHIVEKSSSNWSKKHHSVFPSVLRENGHNRDKSNRSINSWVSRFAISNRLGRGVSTRRCRPALAIQTVKGHQLTEIKLGSFHLQTTYDVSLLLVSN